MDMDVNDEWGGQQSFAFQSQICCQGNKPPPQQSVTDGNRFTVALTLPALTADIGTRTCPPPPPSPGSGSSLSAAVSTVDGGVTMCSGGGL